MKTRVDNRFLVMVFASLLLIVGAYILPTISMTGTSEVVSVTGQLPANIGNATTAHVILVGQTRDRADMDTQSFDEQADLDTDAEFAEMDRDRPTDQADLGRCFAFLGALGRLFPCPPR